MRIDALDLYLIKMSLVGEFVTSFGAVQEREIVLVRAHAGGASGWGESGVDGEPLYSYEDAATCWHIIEDFLAPVILAHEWPSEDLGPAMAGLFSSWRWHPMARAAVEEALWDLEANLRGVSVRHLYAGERESRERIPVGISLGIQDDFGHLAAQISEALDQGYQRINAGQFTQFPGVSSYLFGYHDHDFFISRQRCGRLFADMFIRVQVNDPFRRAYKLDITVLIILDHLSKVNLRHLIGSQIFQRIKAGKFGEGLGVLSHLYRYPRLNLLSYIS